MRKISLAYLTIPGTNPMDQIRIAAECGYDAVGLRTISMHLPGEPEFIMEKDNELFKKTQQALKEFNMPLNDIELARIRPDLNIDDYEMAFERAAQLGASDVLGSVWTRDKAFYVDAVGKVATMAKQYNLAYNIEFLPWAGIRSLQEAITLVDEVAQDNLYIMLDTLHAGRAGVSAAEVSRTDNKYFRFLHICDGAAGANGDAVLDDINDELMLYTARENRLYAGEGVMDIAGYVRAVPNASLTIELPNAQRMKELGAKGHARRCLESTKEYLKAHNVN